MGSRWRREPYLNLTVHRGGQQQMTRHGKQTDSTDTLQGEEREEEGWRRELNVCKRLKALFNRSV